MGGHVLFLVLLCVFSASVRQSLAANSAEKRLANYDLEELQEKLAEFDVDGNGELTELEIELQQPAIQKYLDRYIELLEKTEKGEEEEEEDIANKNDDNQNKPSDSSKKQNADGGAGKTETGNSQQPTPNGMDEDDDEDDDDDDDGVEIETIDELEIVTDDDEETGAFLSTPVLIASLVGIITLAFAIFCLVNMSKQNSAKRQEQEGQYRRRY